MKKVFVIILFFILLLSASAYALEKNTHKTLNERAAGLSANLSYTLSEQLKLPIGLGTPLRGGFFDRKTIRDWISEGGKTEDEPFYSRSVNHYLDPIYGIGFKGKYKTALEWAKNQSGVVLSSDCSWGATRGYYLQGLTSSTKTERETKLAGAFECVGRLMHLVQDMSVPAHTRDDFHILFNYEDWVEGKESQFTSLSIPYGAITSIDPLFWELASYTNANFFSEDTIFDPKYPNPAYTDTDSAVVEVMAEDGLIDKIGYIHFTDQTRKLAAYSYFSVWLKRKTGGIVEFPVGWHYVLDDEVYKDYALLLLPRAAGYSADLLNHFFRGKISMEEDMENPGTYKITNNSSESVNGTFSLYYDDASGNRKSVVGADMSAANGVVLTPGAASTSIPSFTEPTDIKEKGKYMLVFEGTLGQEQGAVVGKEATLSGGVWEDWDRGTYTKTNHYNSTWYIWKKFEWIIYYFNFATELFTLETGSHSWDGHWNTGESPAPSISVEGGSLKIYAATGSWPLYGFNNYYTSYSNNNNRKLTADVSPKIPLVGCRLKMDIPVAEVGYKSTKFLIELTITDGVHHGSYKIVYAVDNVSQLGSWEKAQAILIPTGKVELSLEDGFNHLRNVYQPWGIYLGDISNWKAEKVGLHYSVEGKDNFIRVAVDYIDFICDK